MNIPIKTEESKAERLGAEFEMLMQLEKAYRDYVGKPCNYEFIIMEKNTCIYSKIVKDGVVCEETSYTAGQAR